MKTKSILLSLAAALRGLFTVPAVARGRDTYAPGHPAAFFVRFGLGCLVLLCLLAPAAQGANTFANTGSLATKRSNHTATLLPNGKVLVAGGSNGGTSAEIYDPATGTWTATGSLAATRSGHTATLLPNGKVLVAGGGSSIAELYDPATGTWSATGSLITARSAHTATLLNSGKVLVAGGSGGSYLASVEIYDPAAGTWSATGSLISARQGHTATLLSSGKVLAAGGSNAIGSLGYLNSAELYDPVAGTWSATGAFGASASGRYQHTATLLPNGKVLLAAGYHSFGLPDAFLYDPTAGTWSATGSLATNRYLHTATLLPNGKVLVAGGTNGPYLAASEIYDPATGTWSATGSLATGRAQHTATLLPNGKMLVAAGFGQIGAGLFDNLSSAEIYDSASGTWGATGSLATTRYLHTATLLPNGKVLVAGGANGPAELYDPATGTWSVTGTPAVSRSSHTATLLPNGKVLVVGGSNLTTTELYDPATGTWSTTGALNTARSQHTATLLPNGKVLVAGGYDTSYLASAELYDPATGTWSVTGSLVAARALHSATLLPSGNVLIFAGSNGGGLFGYVTSAELYDPVAGIWSATGALVATGIYSHSATLLPNGKVLIAGGKHRSFSLPDCSIYDPATNTSAATAPMASGRSQHTATLLPNGQVLVTGGAFNGPYIAGAELYDTATGTWSATASLSTARAGHTATLLLNGRILAAAGNNGFSNLSSAELYDVGLGFSAAWQPQITSASFDANGRLVLTGTGFRGISSASGGGNSSQDSPTNYPLVQLRRMDNEQSIFLLSDPAVSVSATAFTSAPVPAWALSQVLVTVFANGIPSAASLTSPAGIAVEQPVGSAVTTGGSRSLGSVAVNTSASLTFAIRNPGGANLTGLTITKGGANAADFSVTASPTAPVAPGGSTTFTVQFAPTTTGAKTAIIHIANNVPGSNPFDINLTGTAVTPQEAWRLQYFGTTSNTGNAADTADPDGDGFNNLFEFVAGLLPNDRTSLFNVSAAPVAGQPGQKTITFGPIVAGRTYVVTSKASLSAPTWLPLTSFSTLDNGTQRTVTDLSATGAAKFYRVEITIP